MTETIPPQLQLLVREYGQNTYQLAQTLLTLEDRAERTRRAQQIVQLMFRLNPNVREQQDYQHKLWNHLYALTGNQLDVDAPFPLTGLDQFTRRPERMSYPAKAPKLRPYGKNVEELVAKASEIEDTAEREQAALTIGRVMKFLVRSHSKEAPKDVTILKHLKDLSGGKLVLEMAQVEAGGGLDMPGAPSGGGRSQAAFVVPQPRSERDQRRGREGGKGDRRDKRRGKKGRDQQQPPQ